MATIFVVVLVAIAAAVGTILLIASSKPSTFRVTRTVTVAAPPATVYALIEDFHRWTAWSPWEERDPAMKRVYEGAERGVGAIYRWDGNNKVGAGRMEVTDAKVPEALSIKLDFLRPFEGHNVADFTLVPAGAGTEVSWVVHGPMVFMGKVMSVFVSMDQLMGNDFARGLAKLKAAAESSGSSG